MGNKGPRPPDSVVNDLAPSEKLVCMPAFTVKCTILTVALDAMPSAVYDTASQVFKDEIFHHPDQIRTIGRGKKVFPTTKPVSFILNDKIPLKNLRLVTESLLCVLEENMFIIKPWSLASARSS